MFIKFLVLGGGILGFWGGGGGECRFNFMGARIFLNRLLSPSLFLCLSS